ncbi:MAG: aminopeptidase P family N-terminal domain-containing protein [Deltaproteobacteria bacterium]|nr:aminopeptidase P family N-terminal domain-containing protein [Deltaproteobacteria bacterium]
MTHPPMPRDHAALLLPASEADRRLDGLRGVLASAGLDAAWLTHGADIEYFIGTRQAGLLIVRTEGDATFFARKNLRAREKREPDRRCASV